MKDKLKKVQKEFKHISSEDKLILNIYNVKDGKKVKKMEIKKNL
jgi:hypothetical protein